MAEVSEKTRLEIHREASRRKEQQLADLLERRRRTESRVKASLNHVAATREGQEVLAWLFHLCGYNLSSIVTDSQSGEVLEGATDHNEARRSVYIDVRRQLEPELRAKVELYAESPISDDTAKK